VFPTNEEGAAIKEFIEVEVGLDEEEEEE